VRARARSSAERGADGHDYLPVIRKIEAALLSHDALFNPDGELATTARYEFHFEEAEFMLEQVRHTGGARQIVSNDAVANGNMFHPGASAPIAEDFRCPCMGE
jgi:hypothetical protein